MTEKMNGTAPTIRTSAGLREALFDEFELDSAETLGVEHKTAYVLAKKIGEFHSCGIEGKSRYAGYWQPPKVVDNPS